MSNPAKNPIIDEEQGGQERKYQRNKDSVKLKDAQVTYYAIVPNRDGTYYQPVYVYNDPLAYPMAAPYYGGYEPVIIGDTEMAQKRRKLWIWCMVIFLIIMVLIAILTTIAVLATPHDAKFRTRHYGYYYTHCNFFTCHRHYYH